MYFNSNYYFLTPIYWLLSTFSRMNKLDEIIAHKKKEIEPRIRPVSDRELLRFGEQSKKSSSFFSALNCGTHLAVIAEIKRRSPSAGAIQPSANAEEQARKYLNAGVDAMSILTDEKYFGGTIRDLWDVNDLLATRASPPPTLRKDFMVHPIQVVDAAEAGARAILIIVRALDDDTIHRLNTSAKMAELDVLFEIHNEADLDKALQHSARIIGVNNRDLSTFTTNIGISESLIPLFPPNIVAVSESGIFTVEDATRAADCGAHAILVGEALMREKDPEELVKAFQACSGR